MNMIISCVGGRGPPLRKKRSPVGSNQWRLHWLTLAQDLVGLAQLAVLALERLELIAARPSSTACPLTQPRNVSRLHPNFSAIEGIACDLDL
ncbi:hypothetical protein N9W17_04510 [Jannaschia sp.]|nr:hypothetical protein [Jannaschia sp.]